MINFGEKLRGVKTGADKTLLRVLTFLFGYFARYEVLNPVYMPIWCIEGRAQKNTPIVNGIWKSDRGEKTKFLVVIHPIEWLSRGVAKTTVISWDGVPNLSLAPKNLSSKVIFWAFSRSVEKPSFMLKSLAVEEFGAKPGLYQDRDRVASRIKYRSFDAKKTA